MNQIQTIDVDYLRSNRTIDTVLITKGCLNKTLWIYNYEGIHFRVFHTLLGVFNFLYNSIEPENSFDSEIELDNFLLNFQLK